MDVGISPTAVARETEEGQPETHVAGRSDAVAANLVRAELPRPDLAKEKAAKHKRRTAMELANPEKDEERETRALPPLDFVPLSFPEGDDDGDYTRLSFMGYYCGLSVDSVNLKFTGNRSVYGKIYINTHLAHVCTVYNRSPEMADTIASPIGGDLSLCGPKYFAGVHGATDLYVELYEVGAIRPFFFQKVDLGPALGPNLSSSVDSCQGEATLRITMTGISPCAPSDIEVMLVYPDSYNEWLVSGSVAAIQTISGGKIDRHLSLFRRAENQPIRAAVEDSCPYPGKHEARIGLDRDVVLAPVWLEKKYILERNALYKRNGFGSTGIQPDNDFANGFGCYLTLEVDLKLVDSVEEGKYCFVQGSLHYQIKGSHADGSVFVAPVKSGPVFKCAGEGKKEYKRPRLSKSLPLSPLDVLIKEEGEIEVLLAVITVFCTMAGEPFEGQVGPSV